MECAALFPELTCNSRTSRAKGIKQAGIVSNLWEVGSVAHLDRQKLVSLIAVLDMGRCRGSNPPERDGGTTYIPNRSVHSQG